MGLQRIFPLRSGVSWLGAPPGRGRAAPAAPSPAAWRPHPVRLSDPAASAGAPAGGRKGEEDGSVRRWPRPGGIGVSQLTYYVRVWA
uniref:Uncharacterized protein n=1 Tax=Siphoviridae sp. ctZF426 TaxID=2827580 RepID=A0A8S5RSF2_9CAUD|nr:MAG TPA: hypothetical protein [Siphoviridae sp. ctZF426]